LRKSFSKTVPWEYKTKTSNITPFLQQSGVGLPNRHQGCSLCRWPGAMAFRSICHNCNLQDLLPIRTDE